MRRKVVLLIRSRRFWRWSKNIFLALQEEIYCVQLTIFYASLNMEKKEARGELSCVGWGCRFFKLQKLKWRCLGTMTHRNSSLLMIPMSPQLWAAVPPMLWVLQGLSGEGLLTVTVHHKLTAHSTVLCPNVVAILSPKPHPSLLLTYCLL